MNIVIVIMMVIIIIVIMKLLSVDILTFILMKNVPIHIDTLKIFIIVMLIKLKNSCCITLKTCATNKKVILQIKKVMLKIIKFY